MAKKIIPRPKAAAISAAQAQRILADFKGRPALMKKKLVFELDAAIREDRYGVARRLAFVCLTQSGAALIKKVEKDREFAVAIADARNAMHNYADALRDLLSWVEEADKRCLVALAVRPDTLAVMDEAVAHG